MTSPKKVALIFVGSVSVALGTIGIFLPLLPSTPFLLLAAACFIRSSDRLYAWLTNNKYLGPYIRNYREKRGMTVCTKATVLSLLWLTIGYSAIFATESLAVRIALAMIAVAVTVHILSLKTLTGE